MWTQLLGHKEAIARMRQAVASNNIAPAYLFAGPDGVGKRRVALALAEESLRINSSEHSEREGEAPPALPVEGATRDPRIVAGTHPDVLLIAPDQEKAVPEISIAHIRAMQSKLQFHALEGTQKIAIIDDADAMHASAANACLKILEEPPPATHFFLISARPHRLLPTIRSRCQTIHFGPLSQGAIMAHLQTEGIDPAEARQRAIVAEGSLGQALRYPAEVIAETVTDMHAVLTHRGEPIVLNTAERWAADASLFPWRLQLLGFLWRDGLARKLAPHHQAALPATNTILTLLEQRSMRRLTQELQDTLTLVRVALDSTVNKVLCCEALLFKLAAA